MKEGIVVWFTGLPASGKSTLARRVRVRLLRRGRACALLDSDDVRRVLVPEPGYTPRGRAAFYRTLAGLAGLLAGQGLVVLVAATAHRRAYRRHAREVAPRFIEIFVDVPIQLCARRDPKGLYARARRGTAKFLPGTGVRFERPTAPDVVADGGRDAAAVERILELLHVVTPRRGR